MWCASEGTTPSSCWRSPLFCPSTSMSWFHTPCVQGMLTMCRPAFCLTGRCGRIRTPGGRRPNALPRICTWPFFTQTPGRSSEPTSLSSWPRSFCRWWRSCWPLRPCVKWLAWCSLAWWCGWPGSKKTSNLCHANHHQRSALAPGKCHDPPGLRGEEDDHSGSGQAAASHLGPQMLRGLAPGYPHVSNVSPKKALWPALPTRT